MAAETVELIRKLKRRGLGPIPLSHEEADLALALIASGAQALARERAREARDDRIHAAALERASPQRRRARRGSEGVAGIVR